MRSSNERDLRQPFPEIPIKSTAESKALAAARKAETELSDSWSTAEKGSITQMILGYLSQITTAITVGVSDEKITELIRELETYLQATENSMNALLDGANSELQDRSQELETLRLEYKGATDVSLSAISELLKARARERADVLRRQESVEDEIANIQSQIETLEFATERKELQEKENLESQLDTLKSQLATIRKAASDNDTESRKLRAYLEAVTIISASKAEVKKILANKTP